jgi:predicted GTPase
MAERYSMPGKPDLKPNLNCPIDRQINVLLLGQTGVGKTTFINAFANYIVHNTIEEAENDEMQIIIPSSFAFTMPATFTEKQITLGNENDYEKFAEVGQSSTQQCRSFVFPIGDRILRFIDTPGVGDT